MNRSYSKKRHIDQVNALIESRFISEKSIIAELDAADLLYATPLAPYKATYDYATGRFDENKAGADAGNALQSKWMAASNPTRYWSILYRQLNETFGYWKLGPTSATDIPEATFFYSGKFVIYKGGNKNFVEYWEDGKLKYYGDIKSNNNRYAGEPIKNTLLTTNLPTEYRGPNGEETLFYFIKNLLGKGTAKSNVNVTNTGGGGTGGGTNTSGWDTTCDGESKPFKKGCKSDVIKKVQGCLGYTGKLLDGKFGSGTEGKVQAKIGKTSFTNADIDKLCATSTNSGGGGTPDLTTVTTTEPQAETPLKQF
jgi:hypothetical protein